MADDLQLAVFVDLDTEKLEVKLAIVPAGVDSGSFSGPIIALAPDVARHVARHLFDAATRAEVIADLHAVVDADAAAAAIHVGQFERQHGRR